MDNKKSVLDSGGGMPLLQLPAFSPKVQVVEEVSYIWDILRKKYVRLTPEEWVRQHVVHYLIKQLGYPAGLMRIERGEWYDRVAKRVDLTVYDRQGKALLLVECKSSQQRLKGTTLQQAATYNQVVGASWLLLTNGRVHACYKLDRTQSQYVPVDHIPTFEAACRG